MVFEDDRRVVGVVRGGEDGQGNGWAGAGPHPSNTQGSRMLPRRRGGAQRRNRTTDTRIFSPLLYRLSYLG